VREQNQDAFETVQLDRNTLLCVVCDGMGGARSGNVASALAADVFTQEVRRSYHGSQDLEQLLERAVKLANYTVFDQSRQLEDFRGMGTTLVAALIRNRQAIVVNVGDSRAYQVDTQDIHQITTDHSLVQVMLERGELTPDQARRFPGKNYITRAIGTESMVECDIYHVDVQQGDCLLLCSDGLSNIIDEQEMLFEVVHGADKANCCQQLLEIAQSRGAPDNVTCVLAQI
jgi:protein phosphatase